MKACETRNNQDVPNRPVVCDASGLLLYCCICLRTHPFVYRYISSRFSSLTPPAQPS